MSREINKEATGTYDPNPPADEPELTAEAACSPKLPKAFKDVAELFSGQKSDKARTRFLRKKRDDGVWFRLTIDTDVQSGTTMYQIRQGIPLGGAKTQENIYELRVDGKNRTMDQRAVISTRQDSMIEGEPEVKDEFDEEDKTRMNEIITAIKEIIEAESKPAEPEEQTVDAEPESGAADG
jgi:hypothetical protein